MFVSYASSVAFVSFVSFVFFVYLFFSRFFFKKKCHRKFSILYRASAAAPIHPPLNSSKPCSATSTGAIALAMQSPIHDTRACCSSCREKSGP